MKLFSNVLHLKSFSIELTLNGKHVLLSFIGSVFGIFFDSIAGYFGYQTLNAYWDFTQQKSIEFQEKNNEILRSSLIREHNSTYQTVIAGNCYPDNGISVILNNLKEMGQYQLSSMKLSGSSLPKEREDSRNFPMYVQHSCH